MCLKKKAKCDSAKETYRCSRPLGLIWFKVREYKEEHCVKVKPP